MGPFDLRYAYVETASKLWNESRSEYVNAAKIGSDFLLARRRAPRALDGAAFLLSPCLIDQHVLHKDASTIPILLAADEDVEEKNRLFAVVETDEDALAWRPNLSELALEHLERLGVKDTGSSRQETRLLWMHALAVGYSPLYLDENGDAIRNDWPRVPLPPDLETLLSSALLGERIGALLNIDSELVGVDTRPSALLATIGSIARPDGQPVRERDLAVEVGWGVSQVRHNTKTGTVSHAVMPGNGSFKQRERTPSPKFPL